jgi:hypothetical protein
MRRLVVLITAVAALALAPGASAFVRTSFFNGGEVSGTGTFGGNTFNLLIFNTPFTGGLVGSLSFAGNDAKGAHSFAAQVNCLGVSSDGASATIVATLSTFTAPVGEPANLAGVLVHATDPEPANSITGVGDKLDVTYLNAKQLQRQLAAGCAPAAAKTPIQGGNVLDVLDVVGTIPV